jgi:predicted DNA-binding transcriptional regulator AlpA
MGMTEEQLAAVRLYTAEEVVKMLGLKPTWLKNWITEKRVPHVRAGGDRGVRFTAAHILEIGGMLPGLLGGHRGGRAVDDTKDRGGEVTQPRAAGESRGATGPTSAALASPVVDIAAWAELKAHTPHSRSK